MSEALPRYHAVADRIRGEILAGTLAPGDRLPTEAKLGDSYEVSRNTIRLALRRLVDEGLLASHQGSGTFVRPRPLPLVLDWSRVESQSRHAEGYRSADDMWAAAVTAAGRTPRQEVKVHIDKPSPAIAERLRLDSERDLIVWRERTRFVDGEPYLLANSYFPYEIANGTPLIHPADVNAPGGVLASLGYRAVRYHDEIRPRMPSRAEIEALRLPAATPVADHIRTSYDAAGRPLRVMVTIAPGHRHVITYDLPAD